MHQADGIQADSLFQLAREVVNTASFLGWHKKMNHWTPWF